MKKGGYQIIDLKDANITTEGVTIKGIYADISTNKRKVILLSGVTIKGVEFSDMFVKVVKVGTDFRLTGYSVAVDNALSTYDFFVEDDDKVSLIEGEVEGGSSGMENPMTTADDIIVGGVDGAPTRLAKGNEGQVLKVGSGGIEWGSDSAGMTNPMTTPGDMIAGSIDGAPYRLPKGTEGQVLTMGASFPEWANAQGGGHLYWHTVKINSNFPALPYAYAIILNDSATAIDAYTTLQAICDDGGKILLVDGEGVFGPNLDRSIPCSLSSATGVQNRVNVEIFNTVSKQYDTMTGDWYSIGIISDYVSQLF